MVVAPIPFSRKEYPFCAMGFDYAKRVVAGEIVACVYVIGACSRFLEEVQPDYSPDYFFDPEAAEKYLRLVQKFAHVTGHWETKEIIYEPWQCWVKMNLMGFYSTTTKFRRFRLCHLEVARGNGKSAMASQMALYFLCLDNPNGNQISSVATKKDQARIVLDAARNMARKNMSFLNTQGVKVQAHQIVHPASNSSVRALSSEASGLDGLNDVLAITDELHAMRRETFDVIYSGMSKRQDSLTLCITTAGMDLESVGYSQSAYAKKVCLGEVQDDQCFAAVYCLDEEDDIYSEENWVKANPNWGVSVDPITFRAKASKTLVSPADIPNFKIKHLNLWISEGKAFFDLKKWDACYDPDLQLSDFLGKACRLGLDLADHLDLTCLFQIFKKEETYYLFEKTFLPQATIDAGARNTLYLEAVASGELIATPGEAINHEFIENQILDTSKKFKVTECLYDGWSAAATAQKLANKVEMLKFQMTVANLSEPMKRLDTLMREGKLRHNGSKLLRWQVGNVVAKEDANGNVYPRKNNKKLKIDSVVACLIALAGWLLDEDDESIYETQPIRRI